MERCLELNVEPGSAFSRLKEGQSVRNRLGQIVHSHQVRNVLSRVYGNSYIGSRVRGSTREPTPCGYL